jgi:hypothetical protein
LFGVFAVAIAACGGGSTTAPVPAPAATTAANVISLPTPPTGTNTLSIPLPGPLGIAPALTLGAGFTAGTQLNVSTSTFGQTQSAERSAQSTFLSCPVLISLTAYFSQPVPIAAVQAFAVNYAQLLGMYSTLGTNFTVSVFDGNAVQTSGAPQPLPAPSGCATAPNPLLVLATATATSSNGLVTFTNFVSNPALAPSVAAKYGLGASGTGTIPANELFGFYVTGTKSSPTPT